MEEPLLSKDALQILAVLCRQYKRRRRSGIPETQAADFGDSCIIQKELFPSKPFESIDAGCRELLAAGLLGGLIADAQVYRAWLTRSGLDFNRRAFSRNASRFSDAVTELILGFLSHLPW